MARGQKEKIFNRVAIIGLGLMGASLGLALKNGRIARTVAGYARRSATRQMALRRKIVDEACATIEKAVKGADLSVLCAPVGVIPQLAKQCAPFLAAHAVMTDVGSVKAGIVSKAQNLFRAGDVRFVGSHPIAGSEQHGLEAARADLYQGAVVVVTPTPRTSKRALKIIGQFWRALGSEIVMLSPQAHDQIIARTSHLPHVIAALLAGCVGRKRAGEYGKYCGAGFRDATRIAEGEPELWYDILKNNAFHLREELEAFEKDLRHLLAGLKKNEGKIIKKYLRLGLERRHCLLSARN